MNSPHEVEYFRDFLKQCTNENCTSGNLTSENHIGENHIGENYTSQGHGANTIHITFLFVFSLTFSTSRLVKSAGFRAFEVMF